MEEKRQNKVEQVDDCCCTPEQKCKPNQCKEGCCKPKELDCPIDISTAKCIPILTDRIYDCKCIHHEQLAYLANETFTIAATTLVYDDGATICIDEICTKYDFIGLQTIPSVIVDNLSPVRDFTPSTNASSHSCRTNTGTDFTIYDGFTGNISTVNAACCKEGINKKIVEQNLDFHVCNLKFTVSGKIGCKAFSAETQSYSGPLTVVGFKLADFYGRLCFPQGKKSITIDETFESCISADCVSALSSYVKDATTFRASIVASFMSDKTIFGIIKEKLVVITTPNGIVCDSSNFISDCQSNCK